MAQAQLLRGDKRCPSRAVQPDQPAYKRLAPGAGRRTGGPRLKRPGEGFDSCGMCSLALRNAAHPLANSTPALSQQATLCLLQPCARQALTLARLAIPRRPISAQSHEEQGPPVAASKPFLGHVMVEVLLDLSQSVNLGPRATSSSLEGLSLLVSSIKHGATGIFAQRGR